MKNYNFKNYENLNSSFLISFFGSLFLLFSFMSCHVIDKNYYRSDMVKLKDELHGKFENIPFEGNKNITLNSIFNLPKDYQILEINSKNQDLIVEVKDTLDKKYFYKFQGDFTNKFYKLYIEYETVTVPLLFSNKKIQYVKFSLNKNNDLVALYEDESSVNILFLGASRGEIYQLVFRRIK